MRHADIRTTMNVYAKAMDASNCEAHGKVVRMLLPPKVAFQGTVRVNQFVMQPWVQ